MGKSITENFHDLTQATQDYIEYTISYHKLDLYKNVMTAAVSGVHKIIIGFILLLALIFLSIALALYLGELLDSDSLGYLIVGALYGTGCVLVYLFLKPVLERSLIRSTSEKLFNDNDEIHLKEEDYENLQ